jgi:hypothetical protein
VEDEVADEVLELAGPGGECPGETQGGFGIRGHQVYEIVAEDGVEHAIGEGGRPLALGFAFEGRSEAEDGAVADDAQDLVAGLLSGRRSGRASPFLRA